MIETRTYPLPDYHRREIFRYAGIRAESAEDELRLSQNLKKCDGVFVGRICFSRFPIVLSGNHIDLGFAALESASLARNLQGCDEIVLFAATVGLGIDRLIKRSGAESMADSMYLQAIGTERVETLRRVFCEDLKSEMALQQRYLRPRFSPGYGDVPLALQNDVFRVLECPRHIGISLSDSLLMSPSKSVTAIVGIGKKRCTPQSDGCSYCDLEGCPFRKETL